MKPTVLELQGDICFRKDDKQFEDALDYYKKSASLNPDNFEIYVKIGKCFEKQREFE
jgi:tetratricopeptide (TPR) repeat protein